MRRYLAHDTAPLQLWWTDLDTMLPPPGAEAALSADERARAARFVRDVHRRRFTAAHMALRELLAQHTGRAAAELQFASGPFGKPALRGQPTCAFNMSHSDELAVYAVATDGDIGVDVERLREMPDTDMLARHNFTPAEQEQLGRAPASARALTFLYGWTRKEACLKAIGCGLQVEPYTFEVGLCPDRRDVSVVSPDGPVRVEVESFCDGDRAVVSWARVKPALPEPTPSA